LEENIEENIVDRKKIDEYSNIAKVQPKTLEGLLYYLNIPDTKQKLVNLLISKRKENARI